MQYKITISENIDIFIEDIKEFIVDNQSYKINSFKSIKDVYNFLKTNILKLTYIKVIKGVHSIEEIEFYFKEKKLHNLSGPAYILNVVDDMGHGLITEYKIENYFINGKEIDYKDFHKHPEVRKAKLNRIINI